MMITTMSQLEELESLRNELDLFDRSSANMIVYDRHPTSLTFSTCFIVPFPSSPLHMRHDELYDVQARARVSV